MSKEIQEVLKQATEDAHDIDAIIVIGIGKKSRLFVSSGFSKRSQVTGAIAEMALASNKFVMGLALADEED